MTLIFIYLPFIYDRLRYVLFISMNLVAPWRWLQSAADKCKGHWIINIVQWVGNGIMRMHIIRYVAYLYAIHICECRCVYEIVFYPFPWLSEVTAFSVSGERGKVGWPGEGMRYSVQVLKHLRLWFICLFLLFLHLCPFICNCTCV